MSKEPSHPTSVRIPDALKREIERRARADDRSFNWMLVNMLQQLVGQKTEAKKEVA